MARLLSVERRQRMLRTIERVVHAIEMSDALPESSHLWARVHLLRVCGWSFVRIEQVHGIPLRSAKRYEAEERGSAVLREAVVFGVIDREDVTRSIAGTA